MILFLSPAPPDGLCSGLRIRAQHSLRALQGAAEVHALHIHHGWGWNSSALPCFPPADPGLVWRRARFRLWPQRFVTEMRFFSRLAQGQLLALWARHRYTRIHLFRAAMLPLVAPLLRMVPSLPVQLDMDEFESSTRRSLGRLAALRGDVALAAMYEREADYFAGLETRWLPRMERVFVSSAVEARRWPGAELLANLPRVVGDPLEWKAPRDLLFVGNLDYYPNRDAVEWLCAEVVPRLRERVNGWRLLIAGSGRFRPPPLPEVVDLGPVEDLRPCYARSVAALVPIRGGGGTRIKALEAFAYGRTVVATSLGVEGLGVDEGVFLADDAVGFAERCAVLLGAPERAREAGLRAHAWVREYAGGRGFEVLTGGEDA